MRRESRDRVHARALLVDPDGRHLDDAPAALAGGGQQVDVEEQVARGEVREHVAHDLAAQHLGAALRVAVGQPHQHPHAAGEARAR